jgi:hypothetical protein
MYEARPLFAAPHIQKVGRSMEIGTSVVVLGLRLPNNMRGHANFKSESKDHFIMWVSHVLNNNCTRIVRVHPA